MAGPFDSGVADQLAPQTDPHAGGAMEQASPTPPAMPQAPAQPQPAAPAPQQQSPQPQQPQQQNDPYAGAPIVKPAEQSKPEQDTNDPYAGAPIVKPAQPQEDNTPFAQNPTLGKVGNAAYEALKDIPAGILKTLESTGAMARGAKPIITNDPQETASNIVQMLMPFLAVPESEATQGATVNKGILPKSAGEITQNPDIQRMEEQASAGLYGGAEGQKAAQDFRTNKSNAMQSEIGKLGTVTEGASKADSMSNAVSIIRDEAEKSKAGVNDAYEAAKETNKTNPITVPKEDLSANLMPKLNEIKNDFNLGRGVQDTQSADVILQKLTDKFTDSAEKTDTAPNSFSNLADTAHAKQASTPPTFEDLELWRRNATNAANNSNSPATKKAIGQMISAYDDYSANVADRLQGNTEGIQAYKDAVAARAAHGARFENNDLLDNIQHIGEKGYPKSVDDLTNDFYSSGAIKGKQGMADNYQALIKAAGTRAPEVQQHLQNGFAQKVFENSTDGRLPGSESPAISPAKLKTQLTNLFVNQRELATNLYGQDTVDRANGLIKELTLSEKQPKVVNNSGTSYMQKHIQNSLTDLLPGWAKFVVNTGKAAFKGGIEAKQAGEASTAFSGQTPKRFQPAVKNPTSQAPAWMTSTAARSAQQQTDELFNKEPK